MGTGTFMVLNSVFIAIVLFLLESKMKLNGFIAILAVAQFWGGLYFFSKWRLYDSNVESMGSSQLDDLLREWVNGIGVFKNHSPGELILVRRKNDLTKTKIALRRVIEIHNELIKRENNNNPESDSRRRLIESMGLFKEELEKI